MNVHLPLRTWLAIVALGPAIVLAIQLLPLLRSLFLLLLVVALLALLIAPLANRLERRGVPRGLTVSAILLGAVMLLIGLVVLLLPVLLNSLDRLLGSMDNLPAQVATRLSELTGSLAVGTLIREFFGQISAMVRWGLSTIGGLLSQAGSLAFALFVGAALVYALVADKRTPFILMEVLVPAKYHARLTSLTVAVSEGLSRWLVAQLLICAYYAVAYSLGLMLVGAPFAIQIGVVSGLLEFIPYLGGIVGLVLSVLSASTVSLTAVLFVLVVETIIGSICVYVVAPFAFSKAVEVPPALILLGLFVGGLIGGFFAALLTVPLLCVILVIYRQLRPASGAADEPA